MNEIFVDASKKYYVYVEDGLLSRVGAFSKENGLWGKAAIISDSNVAPLYMQTVKSSLEDSGFKVCTYVFESGEASKNAETFVEILNFLAENKLSRTDTVFALGGGVVGDMAGFCAATYLRGVNFVQLPTSLLAMVDSSVGGKTAIDLKCGKNLAGAFYQPKFVLCDVNALDTLPSTYYNDAMAEIIKYAFIYDASLVDALKADTPDIKEIITRCIKIKSEVVSKDEFEGGLRKILNFGHTVGHSVELLSDYKITHGNAVAIGMFVIANALEKRGRCKTGTTKELLWLLDKYSLPCKCAFSAESLAEKALNDKKASGDTISLVTISEIGKSGYEKIDFTTLGELIEEGLKE